MRVLILLLVIIAIWLLYRRPLPEREVSIYGIHIDAAIDTGTVVTAYGIRIADDGKESK